jgi:hypothetical protein
MLRQKSVSGMMKRYEYFSMLQKSASGRCAPRNSARKRCLRGFAIPVIILQTARRRRVFFAPLFGRAKSGRVQPLSSGISSADQAEDKKTCGS